MEFDFFGSGYAERFRKAFPKCYINMNNELIIHPGRNSYFSLSGIKDETELKAKVLEWLSREAIKGGTRASMNYHLAGINEVLGTNFCAPQMEEIYTYLGNAVDHRKTVRFIESGYDMEVLSRKEPPFTDQEIQAMKKVSDELQDMTFLKDGLMGADESTGRGE